MSVACDGAPLPVTQALAPLSFTTRTRWTWPGLRPPMPALGSLLLLPMSTQPRYGNRLPPNPLRRPSRPGTWWW